MQVDEAIERFARAVGEQLEAEGYVFEHRETDVVELIVDVFREHVASPEGRDALIAALGGEPVGWYWQRGDESELHDGDAHAVCASDPECRPVFAFPSEDRCK